jgi:hypothetical protein
MHREIVEGQQATHQEINAAQLPEYVRPSIRVMSESELLSAMQINAGGTSWWVM